MVIDWEWKPSKAHVLIFFLVFLYGITFSWFGWKGSFLECGFSDLLLGKVGFLYGLLLHRMTGKAKVIF
jgi:hypothetical protein